MNTEESVIKNKILSIVYPISTANYFGTNNNSYLNTEVKIAVDKIYNEIIKPIKDNQHDK